MPILILELDMRVYKKMERRLIYREFISIAKKDLTILFSLIIILTLFIFGLFPQYLATEDYFYVNLSRRLLPPSTSNPLGTDYLGRDMISLIIWGSRLAIIQMIWPTLIAATIGVTLGLISGYVGGIIDTLIMRLVDVLMSFPSFLLALVILTILGPGLTNAIWAITIGRISGYIRLARSLVLPMKDIGYVEYARALGSTKARIIIKQILPNILTPIIVQMTFSMPGTLAAVASLSFLGLGGKPPTADWGVLLQQSRIYLRYAPWAVFLPSFVIFLISFAFNNLGECLRNIVDPKHKYVKLR